MKKIFHFLILTLLTPVFVCAQDAVGSKLLDNLKTELADISSKKVEIHDIVFNSDGHWLVLYGDIGYSYSYIPTPLENMLVKLNSEGTSINKAVMLNDTSWALVYNDNQYTSQSLPSLLSTDIASAQRKQKNLKALDVSGDKHLIVYGSNGFIAKGLPQRMVQKLAQLNRKRVPIRESSLCGNQGWVLLYGRNGLAFQNVPDDLARLLNKFGKNGTTVNLVRFFGSKWVVVYDGYKVESNI